MWPNESRVPPKVKNIVKIFLNEIFTHKGRKYFENIVWPNTQRRPNESRVPPKVTQYCENFFNQIF